ncbi:MAG TPA: DHH family phosphoesterase [Coriobacteriia bacterium]
MRMWKRGPGVPEAGTSAAAVATALLGSRRVAVCGHVTPDGDAVGSVLALTLALRSVGVPALPVLADHHAGPVTYRFLPGFELYEIADTLDPVDVFVALDTPSWRRLGAAERLARDAATVVVIDHHADNEHFGTLNLVDSSAASASSLVWSLLPALGVQPDEAIATACYTGLVTDTGRFSYGNTTPTALRDAADMIRAGAQAQRVYARVYESRTPASLTLLGRVLSRITIANDGRVAYSWMTDDDLHETGAVPEDTENIVDAVRQVGGVDAVVFFKVQHDQVKVSLRAKCPTLDVAAVAHDFGGGGHTAAAGAAAPLPLESAIEAVLARLPGAKR